MYMVLCQNKLDDWIYIYIYIYIDNDDDDK